MTKPEPGIYPGVSMSEYGSWEAANYSTLKHFDRSAAHAREYMLNPPEPTPAMELGTATHMSILEPDQFFKDYIDAPLVDRRYKKDKEIWKRFLEDHKDQTVLKKDEWNQCIAMSEAARRSPLIVELLDGTGKSEMSFVWVDVETDVLCKGRIDRFGRLWGNSAVADVKTTEDASPRGWSREVARYGYHVQAAMYLDALDAIEPVVERRFLWLALEKKPPFAVGLYEPDFSALDQGRRMYRKYLQRWEICHRTGVWGGYNNSIQSLELPGWALMWDEDD